MLAVVSPAKALDFESRPATRKSSEPDFALEASKLASVMVEQTPADLANLMGISSQLAQTNFERFQNWTEAPSRKVVRQAVLAFNGDTYQGMQAWTFGERDFTHAQKALRILSGLYGLLRPLDLIQPYRLEMGLPIETPTGTGLYGYWKDTVTPQLRDALDESPGSPVLVNLASKEYFDVVDRQKFGADIVTPSFLDEPMNRPGEFAMIGYHAKKARGAMAGWIVRNRIKSPRALKEFSELGYIYDSATSTKAKPIFTRTRASAGLS